MIYQQNRYAVILFIRDYWQTHDYGPSRQEVARAVGLPIGSLDRHIKKLREYGALESSKQGWRNLKPTEYQP